MSTITLESLGFTKEDLQERVIEHISAQLLAGKTYDEDGNEEYADSQFKRKLEERLKKHLDDRVNAIAEEHLLPRVTTLMETLVLQTTNKWGEKKGEPVTFIEYLVQRAEEYIKEDVNHAGKSRSEDSYSWSKSTTRIAYMIHQHLQYNIETAMKKALQEANSAIAGGIEKAVKIKLEEIAAGMKVAVQTK